MTSCLQRIGSKPITFENEFNLKKRALISQRQVKYVEDIIVTRDMENLGMSRRELLQTISDIGKASYYVQAGNHFYYIIREERLPNLKRHEQVIKYQVMTKEGPQICVS